MKQTIAGAFVVIVLALVALWTLTATPAAIRTPETERPQPMRQAYNTPTPMRVEGQPSLLTSLLEEAIASGKDAEAARQNEARIIAQITATAHQESLQRTQIYQATENALIEQKATFEARMAETSMYSQVEAMRYTATNDAAKSTATHAAAMTTATHAAGISTSTAVSQYAIATRQAHNAQLAEARQEVSGWLSVITPFALLIFVMGMMGYSVVRFSPAIVSRIERKPERFATPAPRVEIVQEPITQEPKIPDIAPAEMFVPQSQTIALGVGVNGIITLDPSVQAHLMYSGRTGSGKTMRGLRPLAAWALASGHMVYLANDAAGDFSPLGNHPNLIRVGRNRADIADMMDSISAEIGRRSKALQDAGASLWTASMGSQIWVVVDELVSLAFSADADTAGRIWRGAIEVTSQGRKLGVHLGFGTTDPTYRTLGRLGLIVRDNCTSIAFASRDRATSHAATGETGAEQLRDGQFMVRMGGRVVNGVAFHLSDRQISEVVSRPVTALPRIEIVKTGEDLSLDGRVKSLAIAGKSLTAIAQEVFGYTGGQAIPTVKRILGAN